MQRHVVFALTRVPPMGKDVMCTVGPRSRSQGAQIGALPHIGSMGNIGLHPRQPSITNRPAVPMSGDNVVPGSLCDWQPHVHEVFGPPPIEPNCNYDYEAGFGSPGTLTPGEFAILNQLALAQQSAGGYGYSGHQGIVWDYAAQPSQYGQLAQPLIQPPTEAYLGNLATIDHGLQPETPTSSETSHGHHVSASLTKQEKNRQAAARCRKKGKKELRTLEAREAHLGIENLRLKAEKRKLIEEKLSLIYDILRHERCDDPNIQRYIKSRANEVADTAVAAMPTTWISGSP
ncbi:uncharacterized protein PG986_001887 [Apiospora aurea]|uniref:BZIP domain-containing protein n=1 Tax=Apiospora aurea TaxID=335848 RepID=A0ABR1QY47_9PEZI